MALLVIRLCILTSTVLGQSFTVVGDDQDSRKLMLDTGWVHLAGIYWCFITYYFSGVSGIVASSGHRR
jgi:hypothetical protein